MGSLLPWLDANWFSLFQSLGIGASLLFTAITLRRDIKSERVNQYLSLAGQHQQFWSQIHMRKRLRRVLESDRNLTEMPVSPEEQDFLEMAFVHFHTGWLLAREGSLTPLPLLSRDAGEFFGLPAPAFVWNLKRTVYEPEFVSFVVDAVRERSPRKGAKAPAQA